jgi:hypothetical protein
VAAATADGAASGGDLGLDGSWVAFEAGAPWWRAG